MLPKMQRLCNLPPVHQVLGHQPILRGTLDEAIHANESATNLAAIEDYEKEKAATGGDVPASGGNTAKTGGKSSKRRCTSARQGMF